ncbi:MAG: tRNA 4-thiouridine(8) synthase ThiI [Planctomycetes bacterium]|nr:tRNA 4-thiouridine(8) synthase ThiI [Planctomycetota bacterium]
MEGAPAGNRGCSRPRPRAAGGVPGHRPRRPTRRPGAAARSIRTRGPQRVTRALNREKNKPHAAEFPGFRPTHILLHYDEIALKGKNRIGFEKCLSASVKRALRGAGPLAVHRAYGRHIVELDESADREVCSRRLRRIFGLAAFTPVVRLPCDLDALESYLDSLLEGASPRSFAIACRRANKSLPFTSVDVNRRLGARVEALTGWPVRIGRPDLTIHVHLIDEHAYIGLERIQGPGGLPAGSTGRVVCLLSGGIDSPVAAHHVLRRGASAIFVHFHSAPHTSEASLEKVRELIRRILPHGHRARLYLVPFAGTQHRIIARCPAPLRVVLYRRFMLRAAEAIARREGALATVTGESLGQVASQTLENLGAIDRAAQLPVLRPLIGLHKAHIVDEARRIGTFDISIEPHDDCCSYLMPSQPATRSTPEQLDAAEQPLDVASEVETLLAEAAVETVDGGD